jgi:hypothetical protein
MGFLDKLFGNSPKQEERKQIKPKVRAQFKDAKYFEKEIEKFYKIILDSEIQIKNNNITVKPFNFWSISTKYQRIIKLKYSLGGGVNSLINEYENALINYLKGWDKDEATYADMLDIVSLGILLEISNEKFQNLIDYVIKTDNNTNLKDWHPDGLVWYLLNSRNIIDKKEENKIMFPKLYGKLFQIAQLPKLEAEKAIKDYLEVWYSLHQTDPWYNTHLRDSGYSGYWAWEVAALVKVIGLNDSSFKDNPYYPYDMVHWNDANK